MMTFLKFISRRLMQHCTFNSLQNTDNCILLSRWNVDHILHFEVTVTQKPSVKKMYKFTLLFRVVGSTSMPYFISLW